MRALSASARLKLQATEAEVRELERTCRSLEDALGEARRADERMAAGLAAAEKRIADAAWRSVPSPDDAAIPQRITENVRDVFTTAEKLLREQWTQVCDLVGRVLKRATDELISKKKLLRRLEWEASAR